MQQKKTRITIVNKKKELAQFMKNEELGICIAFYDGLGRQPDYSPPGSLLVRVNANYENHLQLLRFVQLCVAPPPRLLPGRALMSAICKQKQCENVEKKHQRFFFCL